MSISHIEHSLLPKILLGQTDQVELLSEEEIEMNFYEEFFLSKDLEPYPVQEEAFNHIFANNNVMITVPTGTGKTMIAKAGMYKALHSGKTAIYTTPLRALTEEKYRELCEDFGPQNVGFATGDYKVNPSAPIQVVVAEILWNRIFGARQVMPADIVIMDEGHYFNDYSRGYVWEQSIIGLHPLTQLVILSATVGNPQQFCQWAYVTRRVPMHLVLSNIRRVPLFHEYEETYLLDKVKELFNAGEYPVIIFNFSRQQCFEYARLLKSCRRFTTPEEQEEIAKQMEFVIRDEGIGPHLKSLLTHGIGIHHAGILPAYKRLVEELTLQRLLKFIVSTETISAGINLPAKRVIFPSLRKRVRGKSRILIPAEYHQMAGRAGRPQFDTEGIAITLAPEDIVQEFRKELRNAQKARRTYDEAQIKKRAYSRARTEAQRRGDVIWDGEVHEKLIEGKSAPLRSHTRINAGQILAIGLPDLTKEKLPGMEIVLEEAKAAEEARKAKEAEEAQKAEEAKQREEAKKAEEAEKAKQAEEEAKKAEEEKKEKKKGSFNNNPFANPFQLALTGKGNKEKKKNKKDKHKSKPAKVETPKKEEVKAEEAKKAETTKTDPTSILGDIQGLPAYMRLNIRTVIDNLLLNPAQKVDAHKELAKVTRNLFSLQILDTQGKQIRGDMIGELKGIDGMFTYYTLMKHELSYEQCIEMVEFMVDHNAIQRRLDRVNDDKRREWIRNRLRERRAEESIVSWEDVEAEYEKKFPKELTFIEKVHKEFQSQLAHPELHGGKTPKTIWKMFEEEELSFMEFVEKHKLEEEEGSLFSYLTRVLKMAKSLYEVTLLTDFYLIETRVRLKLAVLDERMLDDPWHYKEEHRRPPAKFRPMRVGSFKY